MGSEQEADGLMKKAEKMLRPSVLSMRLKPCWDDALPLFVKAAQQYKYRECDAKAIVAYEKAAEANLRGGGTEWHAAKHLEDASKLSVKLRKYNQAAEFSKQASQQYLNCGKTINASECLARGAKWLTEADPELACGLYKEAVAMYSRSEVSALAHDVVQQAVGLMLQAGKIGDAASVMLEWATICHRIGNTSHLCRAYLGDKLQFVGIIILHLYSGDAQQAWTSYQDFLDVDDFSSSAEAYAVENLLGAYSSGDIEQIKSKTSKGSCWRALDSQLGRIAKELPSSHSNLQKMSAFFSIQMKEEGPVEEEEEGEDDEFLT